MVSGSFLRASALVASGSLISKLFNFAAMVLIARILTQQELGLLDISIVFFTIFLPTFALNSFNYLQLKIPQLKEEKKTKTVISSILTGIGIFYTAFLIIALLARDFISVYFPIESNSLYILLILAGFFYWINFFFQYAFQSLQQFKNYSITLLLQSFTFLLLVLLDYFFNIGNIIEQYRVTGIALMYLISYLPAILFSIIILKPNPLLFSWSPIKDFLKTVPRVFWIPSFLGILTMLFRVGIFFSDPTQSAYLRVMDIFFQPVYLVAGSIMLVFFPKMVSLIAEKNQSNAIIWLNIKKYLVYSFIALFTFGIAAIIILPIVFGPSYFPTQDFIALYTISLMLAVFSGPFSYLALADKNRHIWMLVQVILSTYPIPFFLLGIHIGLVEYLLSTTIVNLIACLLYFNTLKKEMKFDGSFYTQFLLFVGINFALFYTYSTLFGTITSTMIGIIHTILIVMILFFYKLLLPQDALKLIKSFLKKS